MKKIGIVALAASLLAGCGTSGMRGVTAPTSPLERLKYDIDQVLADSIFIPTLASIKVVSLETHEILYDRGSKLLFRPASNMKLLTSSTALGVLGKDFKFKTAVYSDTLPLNGVVFGNIYVKGFGDPDLKTAHLDSMARQVESLGVTAIIGDVVADASYFDDEFWGNGWMWDDEPDASEMFITPLSVNDNCVNIRVQPGMVAGEPARVAVEPNTDYVLLINFARTVTDTVLQPLRVTRLFKERLNTIVVDGQILAGSEPVEQQISVWKPELYAAQLFKEALNRSGITVRGHATTGRHSDTRGNEIASHYQTMDSMVVHLNKVSDNLSAENTLKTMAAVKRGAPGTAPGGIAIVNEFLSSLGIDTTKHLMVDGSGVSHYNLVTTELIVQILVAMPHDHPDIFPLFYESLPIAGVDGTLRGRMMATLAEGNLRAKSGSISGVSSLSGYVRTRDGEMLVFSMMMQNFIAPSKLYRDAQDKIGAILARFSRKGIAANLIDGISPH